MVNTSMSEGEKVLAHTDLSAGNKWSFLPQSPLSVVQTCADVEGVTGNILTRPLKNGPRYLPLQWTQGAFLNLSPYLDGVIRECEYGGLYGDHTEI